jgi:hypothetical protein
MKTGVALVAAAVVLGGGYALAKSGDDEPEGRVFRLRQEHR